MATQTHTNSAKILSFPVGGRRELANSKPLPEARPVVIDAWYHQAAIADEDCDRSH